MVNPLEPMTPADDLPPMPDPNWFMLGISDSPRPPLRKWAQDYGVACALAARAERDERIKELEDSEGFGTQNRLLMLAAKRAEAAEARVKDFQEALNTAQRCIVEAETERDTLRTRVAELEEKLMVMCVWQISEDANAARYRWLLRYLTVERSEPKGYTCWLELAQIPYRSMITDPSQLLDELMTRFPLVPSPDPPAPAPLAAQGVEGEPHHER